MFCLWNFHSDKISDNVLALGAVADFGAQNFHLTTKVDARQNVQLTTTPAIEPNACYKPFLFFPFVNKFKFIVS